MMPSIYVFSSKPQSRAFAANPGRTVIGPVILKILDQYGLEIALPSPNDGLRTSYVMKSRGKSRFVDEIHIPNAELRSRYSLNFRKWQKLLHVPRRL